MMEVLIPYVNCFIVEDADGDRLLAKYYDGRVKADQMKFEAMLHKKTKAIIAKTDRKYTQTLKSFILRNIFICIVLYSRGSSA